MLYNINFKNIGTDSTTIKIRKALKSANKSRGKINANVDYYDRSNIMSKPLSKGTQNYSTKRKASNGLDSQYELVYSSVIDPKLISFQHEDFNSNHRVKGADSLNLTRSIDVNNFHKHRTKNFKLNQRLSNICSNYTRVRRKDKNHPSKGSKTIHLEVDERARGKCLKFKLSSSTPHKETDRSQRFRNNSDLPETTDSIS